MQSANTLFVRVVPQSHNRGYILLCGFESSVTQRTAVQYETLGGITRIMLANAIAAMQQKHKAIAVSDVTSSNIVKKLEKMFGDDEFVFTD